MNINYKSDFVLAIEFEDGIPTLPWSITFRSKDKSLPVARGQYIASFDGESYCNAHINTYAENQIIVEFVEHYLPPGVLTLEWRTLAENDMFTSGLQNITTPQVEDITLVTGAGDEVIDPQVISLAYPLIKGEQGEQGEKGDQGEPGEPGPSVVSSIETESVTIDNDGLFIDVNNSTTTNVLGGLLARFSLNSSGEIWDTWTHPSLGTSAGFTYSLSSNGATSYLTLSGWSITNCIVQVCGGMSTSAVTSVQKANSSQFIIYSTYINSTTLTLQPFTLLFYEYNI